MDTLTFGYILPTTGRIRDLHPLETCAAGRTPKKGRHISRADLFMSFFNFHGSLISVSLPLLIPASVLPDKPAVRCHAVCEHDSLCSVGNRIKVIPLSVDLDPTGLHSCVDVHIEPVSVNRIKDPSGTQIAIRTK